MTKISCTDPDGKIHEFEEREYVERPSVYGVLIEEGKLLLVKDLWGKKWGLPGGGIDAGETETQALIREFQEETKLTVEVLGNQLFSDISYFLGTDEPHPWKTLRSFYRVKSLGGILETTGNHEDVLQAAFFSFAEIENIELQPNSSHLIQKIKELEKM